MKLFKKIKSYFYTKRKEDIENNKKVRADELSFYTYKKVALDELKNNIKTLILGSSHGLAAFNPDISKDKSIFNLCFGSQDLYYSYKMYEKYASELKNLKTVLCFYSVFSPGSDLTKSPYKHLIQYYKYVYDIDYRDENDKIYYKKELDFLNKRFCNIYKNENYRGFQALEGSNIDDEKGRHEIKAHVKISNLHTNQEDYILKMYDIAKKYNHKLIIVIPAFSPKYYEICKEECEKQNVAYDKIFSSVYEIQKDKDIEIMNFFEYEGFEQGDFYDYEHMNNKGANKITKLIMEKLGEEYEDTNTI